MAANGYDEADKRDAQRQADEVAANMAAQDKARRTGRAMQSANTEMAAVGRYVQETDPETAARLGNDSGYRTAMRIGRYVLSTDPDMYARIVEHVTQEGDR